MQPVRKRIHGANASTSSHFILSIKASTSCAALLLLSDLNLLFLYSHLCTHTTLPFQLFLAAERLDYLAFKGLFLPKLFYETDDNKLSHEFFISVI